jgi:hypothetical protein
MTAQGRPCPSSRRRCPDIAKSSPCALRSPLPAVTVARTTLRGLGRLVSPQCCMISDVPIDLKARLPASCPDQTRSTAILGAAATVILCPVTGFEFPRHQAAHGRRLSRWNHEMNPRGRFVQQSLLPWSCALTGQNLILDGGLVFG